MNPKSLVSPNAQNTTLPFAFAGPSAMLFANFLAPNSDHADDVSAPVMPRTGDDSPASANLPLKKNVAAPAPIGKSKTAQDKNDPSGGSGPSQPAPFAIPVPIDVPAWTPSQPPCGGSVGTPGNQGNAIDSTNSQLRSSSADTSQDDFLRLAPSGQANFSEQVEALPAPAEVTPQFVTGLPVSTEDYDSQVAAVSGSKDGLVVPVADQDESTLRDTHTQCSIDETVPAIAADGPPQLAACMPAAITPAMGSDLLESNQLNAASAGDTAVLEPQLPARTPQTSATTPNCTALPNLTSGVAIPYSIHKLTGPANSAINSATAARSTNPRALHSGNKPPATDAIGWRSAPEAQIASMKTHASQAQHPLSGPLGAQPADHTAQAQNSCVANQDERKASFEIGSNPELKNSEAHASHNGSTHSEKSNTRTSSAAAKANSGNPVLDTGADISNPDTDAQSSRAQTNPGSLSPTLVQPMLSSNALSDASAGQTSTPAAGAPQTTHTTGTKTDALPSPTAKPIEEPHPSASSSVQGVRFVQNPAQAEMRVGLRTESFGTVQVHTSISDKAVDVTLGSEHGDLKSLMVSELPALQSALQQHDLRLQQLRTVLPSYSPQPDMFAGNGGESRQSHQQGGRPTAFQFREPSTEVDEVPRVNAGGLSIRA